MRNDGVSAKILYVGISPELDIGEPIDEWTSLRQCTQYVSNCIEFQPECKTVSNSWLFFTARARLSPCQRRTKPSGCRSARQLMY